MNDLEKHPATGKVQTVRGPIDPADLGVTLTHEHILIDLLDAHGAGPEEAGAAGFYVRPLSIENVGYVRHHKWRNEDNARLSDISAAVDEVLLYKQFGGGALVDATSLGIGRDPVGLSRVSAATGVHIVMGGSYYVESAHPPDMDSRTEEDLTREMVSDITVGADGTRIRTGVIGEVGCSWPVTDNERKVLRASAHAQRRTGAPILIHPGRNPRGPFQVLEVLREAGADMSHVIMGHIERSLFDRRDFVRLADSGCYIEWDLFGQEQSFYGVGRRIDMPSDATRMDTIAWMVAEGYGDRILVAHDVCHKIETRGYGGKGYLYLLGQVVPRMLERGLDRRAIERILVQNPAEALTFREPVTGGVTPNQPTE